MSALAYGNTKVQNRILRDGLSRVSIFTGPQSVGKTTLARLALQWAGISLREILELDGRLTTSQARTAEQFAHTAPGRGQLRGIIAHIDGASPTAVNVLLKTLEEELPIKVILVSRGVSDVPEVLRSRAQEYRFGLLASREVASVLMENYRFKQETALELARRSGGTIQGALSAARTGKPKLGVLVAVRAIQERDSETLLRVASDWTDEHTETLVAWCSEAVSHRYRTFTEDEIGPQRGFKLPLKILTALSLAETRPRLVVRTALMDVLTKE